jgi:predicted HTH transcriptional regulator
MVVGMGGAVVAVIISTAALLAYKRRRARGVPDASVEDLIAAGEGDRVEFKSTARWNIKTAAKDARMEEEIALTVAGFMNASGGTLLIGVDDDGRIHGLEDDYAVVPRGDRDGFELWLRNLLADRLGRAVTADVGVSFLAIGAHDVCRVDVAPADRPVFVSGTGGNRAADFHLRVGNSTRKLLTDETLDYRATRWP